MDGACLAWPLHVQVFIMSHPDIRATIDQLFARERLRAVYLGFDQLPRALTRSVHSAVARSHEAAVQAAAVTLLGFLEQEVCAQAHVFLGTALSSMSRAVLLLRVGPGGADARGKRSTLLAANFKKPNSKKPN